MRYFIVLLTVLILPFYLFADDRFLQVPKEAKSRDELVRTFGKTRLFGYVQRAEFCRRCRQIFVVWYDPYSGVEANYLHAYYYDPSKSEWILFINRCFENVPDLSAEMPSNGDTLVIRNEADKVVLEQSVAKLPMEKP